MEGSIFSDNSEGGRRLGKDRAGGHQHSKRNSCELHFELLYCGDI
jgi:hypothetical protein